MNIQERICRCSCCLLRFVELAAGDQAAPGCTYFSVMLLQQSQIAMVGAELRLRVVARPRKARVTVVVAQPPVRGPHGIRKINHVKTVFQPNCFWGSPEQRVYGGFCVRKRHFVQTLRSVTQRVWMQLLVQLNALGAGRTSQILAT